MASAVMCSCRRKARQDQFTLAGELELMLRQVLRKHIHFFRWFSSWRMEPVQERHIKDESAQWVKGPEANRCDQRLTKRNAPVYSPTRLRNYRRRFACGNLMR